MGEVRGWCHELIDLLDVGGLHEAHETLCRMVQFYNTPTRPASPEAPPKILPASFGGRYAAPVHSLPEDLN